MVYSHIWPLSSHACRRINWNWTQIKLKSSLFGTNESGANTSLCFLLSFFAVKTNPAKSVRNLGVICDKNFTFAHMCRQCVAHAFIICGICVVFAVTLIWIVQIYLQLLLYPVVSIVVIHFCMVLSTLTSQGFTCTESTGPPGDKVSSIYSHCSTLRLFNWLPITIRILFKVNSLTYNTLHVKQPVYHHSMLSTSLPARSRRSNNDNSLSVSRVKTNTCARAFHSCAPSLQSNLPLSVSSAIFSCYL